jgi:hypothetical protein
MPRVFRRQPASIAATLAMSWAVTWAGAALAAGSGASAPSLARPSAQPRDVVVRWLAQNTSIAPASVVSVGDEYIVAVLSSHPVDPAQPRVLSLEIRAEMTDPDSTTASLLRSLSANLDINCRDHTSHFIEVRTFTGPNLTGTEQVTRPVEGWAPNPRGSYFEDIDAAVCTPNGPRPLLAARANSAPLPSRPERVLSAPLRPALQPDDPAVVRHAAPARAQLARAPAPKAPIQHAPIQHAPIQHAPVPRTGSGGAAQIAAAGSEAKAKAALAELQAAQPALTNGLSTRVERIDRGGVAYYRALVAGFSPPMTVASFCRRLAASGRACIIR